MKNKKYFKINEFAKLCHTSKDTLLHYDRKGLLKPKNTAENGYRYYTVGQFFAYDLIGVLKDTGSTLEEIKTYLENPPSELVRIIRERTELLQKEQEKISRRIAMLTTLADLTSQALENRYNELFFEEQPKETVRLLPVKTVALTDPEERAVCYSDCLLECLLYGNNIDPPMGMLIPKNSLTKKQFDIRYLFTRNLERANVKSKTIKKGKYACLLHRGNIESHEKAFLRFIGELEKQSLAADSDLFLYNQMNYLLTDANDNFILKYAVKIG